MISRLPNDGVGSERFADMAELSVLVPGWQAQALEDVAHAQGVTTAQVMRRLIHEFCTGRAEDTEGHFVLKWTK